MQIERILKWSVFAALIAAALVEPRAAQAQRGGICFFEHSDFRGRSYCIRPGQRVDFVGPAFNDTFSSVDMPPGVSVRVCEHAHFRGRCVDLDRSVRNLTRLGMNDDISSVAADRDRPRRDRDLDRPPPRDREFDRHDDRPRRDVDRHADRPRGGQVCFFEDANFQGDRFCVPVGEPVDFVGPRFNDKFSSLTAPPGVRVTACEHAHFNGRCRDFRGTVAFVGPGWNDAISSFRSSRH